MFNREFYNFGVFVMPCIVSHIDHKLPGTRDIIDQWLSPELLLVQTKRRLLMNQLGLPVTNCLFLCRV